jgi:hypothetical protein
METIAFYSYKGGVGRTLLVANAARFLGMVGRRVVALDLDFEAPGLHYKLGRAPRLDQPPSMLGGAVPYLVATARSAKNPPSLEEHMIEIPLPSESGGWLALMPAGAAPHREYWKSLKQLRERLRLDDPSGKGVAALLDLHTRIQDELKPDYLLIDARTGVTELGGLATTSLADCVVCLLVANQESLDGTLTIVEALRAKATATPASEESLRVVPVLARTSEYPTWDGQVGQGVNRLLEVGEGRNVEGTEKLRPFVLPHDERHGATDTIIGGEQKASAFSALHRAYLRLFQQLFHQASKKAEQVLDRLEAVADIKKELTTAHDRRHGRRSGFPPWPDSAIDEGIFLACDSHGNTRRRYADLVCRDERGQPLIIVEYVAEKDDRSALEYWSDCTVGPSRCLILIGRSSKSHYYTTTLYFREGSYQDFRPSERRDPPFPKEFEVFPFPGQITDESMFQGLQRGHSELVPLIVSQWFQYMVAPTITGWKRGPRWRPVEARNLLNRLASIENTEVCVEILRHAASTSFLPLEFLEFRNREGSGSAHALPQEKLFAPLFWRLPVEAAIEYLARPEHPGWMPCPAAHRLLAEKVMGLRFDPMERAVQDAQYLVGQVARERTNTDEEQQLLHRAAALLFRSTMPLLSDDPPPLLVWDVRLQEDSYWWGDREVDDKTCSQAMELAGSEGGIQRWLRERLDRNALVTFGLLGHYDSELGRIILYPRVLDALALNLTIQPRYLKSVVFIQLSVAALARQARDLDDQPGFGFTALSAASPFVPESPALIVVIQYFTRRLITMLGDAYLKAAFQSLSDKQPEPYRQWRGMEHLPVERMRAALIRARLGESALDLPGTAPKS